MRIFFIPKMNYCISRPGLSLLHQLCNYTNNDMLVWNISNVLFSLDFYPDSIPVFWKVRWNGCIQKMNGTKNITQGYIKDEKYESHPWKKKDRQIHALRVYVANICLTMGFLLTSSWLRTHWVFFIQTCVIQGWCENPFKVG